VATKFTEVDDRQAATTLARDFIGLADDLRDLLTQFGLRTYRVTRVRVEWSGRSRGAGVPTVVAEDVMLPTPKIELDPVGEFLQPIGLTEQGAITLSQVSGRFSEEDLRGFDSATADGITGNAEFYYEIEFFPHTGPAVRRRFYPRGAPVYHPGRLQWSMRLERSSADRQRDGDTG
jgi:hypothetical protein